MTTDSPIAAQSLFAAYAGVIDAALDALVAKDALPAGLARGAVTCEPPRDAAHGDLATNAAMVLAKPAGTNPRALATCWWRNWPPIRASPVPRSPGRASSTCAWSMPRGSTNSP
jgi:hypothetical protein